MAKTQWSSRDSKVRLWFANVLVFCLFFTIGFWSYRISVYPEASYAETPLLESTGEPALSLALSDTELIADDSTIATVQTTNATGYQLTLASTNDDSSLSYARVLSPSVNAVADDTYTPIPSVSNPVTLRNVNRAPIVDTTNRLAARRTNDQETEVKVNAAVLVSNQQDTLVFTAVANYLP